MTVSQLAKHPSFTPAYLASEDHTLTGVYCCDLLSVAMGRAPADSAWVTVMGNLNAIAVAVLCDVPLLVIAENMGIDEDARKKAQEEGISLFQTELSVFDAALIIHKALSA